MKTLILTLVLLTAISFSSHAQLKFYYYPSTNVYYDVVQSRYIYQENGSWIPVKVLPAKFKSSNGPRYIVYNKTPDVWVVNDAHLKKYKTKNNLPHGKAVGYKGTHPHKGARVTKVKVSKH